MSSAWTCVAGPLAALRRCYERTQRVFVPLKRRRSNTSHLQKSAQYAYSSHNNHGCAGGYYCAFFASSEGGVATAIVANKWELMGLAGAAAVLKQQQAGGFDVSGSPIVDLTRQRRTVFKPSQKKHRSLLSYGVLRSRQQDLFKKIFTGVLARVQRAPVAEDLARGSNTTGRNGNTTGISNDAPQGVAMAAEKRKYTKL